MSRRISVSRSDILSSFLWVLWLQKDRVPTILEKGKPSSSASDEFLGDEDGASSEANDPDLDPHGLDSDVDYVACESNACPCANEAKPEPPPPSPKPRRYRAVRAQKGHVEAVLSYVVRSGRYLNRYRSRRITIVRNTSS
jgi:hypothetical protein